MMLLLGILLLDTNNASLYKCLDSTWLATTMQNSTNDDDNNNNNRPLVVACNQGGAQRQLHWGICRDCVCTITLAGYYLQIMLKEGTPLMNKMFKMVGLDPSDVNSPLYRSDIAAVCDECISDRRFYVVRKLEFCFTRHKQSNGESTKCCVWSFFNVWLYAVY